MVISIVASQLIVFVCLFLKTFEAGLVSKENVNCVAQGKIIINIYSNLHVKPYSNLLASLTYYFILCSFGWLSAMSYNIMTKFRSFKCKVVSYLEKKGNFFCRVSTILPKDADKRRFQVYSCFCFGLPLIMFVIVLTIDRSMDYENEESFISAIRPGFGEEACWFTSCSSALSIFLYG